MENIENKKIKKNFKISEVAKKFNITRTALIHYDHVGLLSPSLRNQKNYRFYTPKDLKKLELILVLKESGLSLKEIKDYLFKLNDKTSLELLMLQKKKVDEKIQQLKEQSEIISKRIKQLELFTGLDFYEGMKVAEYADLYLFTEKVEAITFTHYDLAFKNLKERLSALNENMVLSSKFGVCFDLYKKSQEGYYYANYIFDYLNADVYADLHGSINDECVIKLPKRFYLCFLHEGSYTSMDLSIEKMKNYAKRHRYKLDDMAYFIPLLDYFELTSKEHVSEILIPMVVSD